MAERLSGGNGALTLLANALATGAVLYAVIVAYGPVSGAHFNPLVSFEAASRGDCTRLEAMIRAAAQTAGAVSGVALANAMFDLPVWFASQKVRGGFPQLLAEAAATFGLLVVIRLAKSPSTIAAYIVGAYWFTSSTSFANPAITLGRSLTDTFSGIRPADVPAFTAAQTAGCVAAGLFTQWLQRGEES
jgi:glycerol uptake facilitator-like aquaporin